jgi:hypothetical protein
MESSRRRVMVIGNSAMMLALAATSAVAAPAPVRQVRLYVVQDPGGFKDDNSDSAADIANSFRLASDPKSIKDLVIRVESRADADLVLEIVGRSRVDTGGKTVSQ